MQSLQRRIEQPVLAMLLDARSASYVRHPSDGARGGRRNAGDASGASASPFLQRIPDTTQTPYRYTCFLEITPQSGPALQGTGWLAGPRTVITAGHCLFQRNLNTWASTIRVHIAMDGPTQYYQIQDSHNLHSVAQWVSEGQEAYDYGAIILNTPVDAGSFGLHDASDGDLQSLLVSLLGYPLLLADDGTTVRSDNGTMWGDQTFLSSVQPAQIFYGMQALPGMSGGPVFYTFNGGRYVVGIHNYGSPSGNYATRITAPVKKDILAWAS
jgi:V8-like Glu-specific endopeptidase